MYIRKPCGASNKQQIVHQLEPEVHRLSLSVRTRSSSVIVLSSFGSLCAQCAHLIIRLLCLLSIIALIIFTCRKSILCVGICIFLTSTV
jgi:hypothetical protein